MIWILVLFRKVRSHGLLNSLIISKNLLVRCYLRMRSNNHFMLVSGVRREILGERLLNQLKSEVKYGHLKGMRLKSTTWSKRDIGSLLLGEYEKQVIDYVQTLPTKYSVFIDVGAADGIYAVGFLKNGRFETTYCFESIESSRNSILTNAIANAVESRIRILETATANFLKNLVNNYSVELSKAFVLIDIEGGEYDLLSLDNLQMLKESTVIVEIHQDVNDYAAKYEKLLKIASDIFDVQTLTRSCNPRTEFLEIKEWPDEDRQILFSEGRRYAMEWLVLIPKSQNRHEAIPRDSSLGVGPNE